METTARHYTSPTTPPRLVVHTPGVAISAPTSPVLCLRCGSSVGHASHRLVSFDWGRVAPSQLRR